MDSNAETEHSTGAVSIPLAHVEECEHAYNKPSKEVKPRVGVARESSEVVNSHYRRSRLDNG
jgi:hypothetical protein